VEAFEDLDGDETPGADLVAASNLIERAEEAMNDFQRGLRSDVYEFRKRAERAALHPTASPQEPK
jgi:hypothetical protein